MKEYTLVNKLFSLEMQVHKLNQYSTVSTLFYTNTWV